MAVEEAYLDRVLTMEVGRCTEAAAVAASTMIGRGDKEAADDAAVSALRAAFNKLEMDGTVVIGEGKIETTLVIMRASAVYVSGCKARI